jgi:hypothetical protein
VVNDSLKTKDFLPEARSWRDREHGRSRTIYPRALMKIQARKAPGAIASP